MSFGSSKAALPEKPKLFGAPQEMVDTNEGARVIPFFCGTRWLGVTWLGDAFNVKTTPVKKKVGKKKTIIGYDYYASFAGLIALGPGDLLSEIHFDDDIVWEGSVARGAESSVLISVEDRGNLTLQWGTETQTLNSILSASGIDHAAYRGQMVLIGDQILFGQDRTNAPNIKLRLSRFPRPSWLSAATARVGNDVNPVVALWDVWTNKRGGLGRSESLLDITRLQSVATTLKNDGIGISPLLTSEEEMKGFVLKWLEHVDGYPTSYSRKFGVGLVRDGDSSVTLDYSDFESEPTFSTQLWPDTFSECRVRFKDDELDGLDNSARYQDLANYQITGVRKVVSIDRPWVTSHSVAAKIAAAMGKAAAVPQTTGRGTLRDSQLGSLDVGSVFNFTTRDGKTLRMRITDKTFDGPDSRRVSIAFESDRGWSAAAPYVATPVTIPPTPRYLPSAPSAAELQDAPYALTASGNDSRIFSVARGDRHSTGFDVHRGNASAGPYVSAATDHRSGALFDGFGTKAKLLTAYGAGGPLLDLYTGISFQVLAGDVDLLAEEYLVTDAYNHELLAIFPTEIMALHTLHKTGAATYTAKTLRGLYDRLRNAHSAGTEFWIHLRTRIPVDPWPPSDQITRYYKFQPTFGPAEVDLSTLNAVSHAGNQRALLPLRVLNLRANGDKASPVWQTGNNVVLTWDNSARERSKLDRAISDVVTTDLTDVKLELRSHNSATLHDTVTTSASSGTYTMTNAYLVSKVNADFSVRAYGVRNGHVSLEYSSVKVDKA